jgi:hypothetical protein
MTFQNTAWGKDEQLAASKIQKMINNDNYNYDLIKRSPRGLLYSYTFPSTGLNLVVNSSNPTGLTSFINNVNIFGKNFNNSARLVKISLSDCTFVNNVAGNNDRGVVFKFTHTNPVVEIPPESVGTPGIFEEEIEVVSDFNPVTTLSKQVNSRTQAFEFIIRPNWPNFIFSADVRVRQRATTTPAQGTYQITFGQVAIYDMGAG